MSQKPHRTPYLAYAEEVARIVKIKDVCDVCKNPRRKVKRYRVQWDSDVVAVYLCSEHGEYLDKLLKLGERVPNQSPRAKVWSMEEIEAEKRRQERRKPPSA